MSSPTVLLPARSLLVPTPPTQKREQHASARPRSRRRPAVLSPAVGGGQLTCRKHDMLKRSHATTPGLIVRAETAHSTLSPRRGTRRGLPRSGALCPPALQLRGASPPAPSATSRRPAGRAAAGCRAWARASRARARRTSRSSGARWRRKRSTPPGQTGRSTLGRVCARFRVGGCRATPSTPRGGGRGGRPPAQPRSG